MEGCDSAEKTKGATDHPEVSSERNQEHKSCYCGPMMLEMKAGNRFEMPSSMIIHSQLELSKTKKKKAWNTHLISSRRSTS
jgi:hypothetical protein